MNFVVLTLSKVSTSMSHWLIILGHPSNSIQRGGGWIALYFELIHFDLENTIFRLQSVPNYILSCISYPLPDQLPASIINTDCSLAARLACQALIMEWLFTQCFIFFTRCELLSMINYAFPGSTFPTVSRLDSIWNRRSEVRLGWAVTASRTNNVSLLLSPSEIPQWSLTALLFQLLAIWVMKQRGCWI